MIFDSKNMFSAEQALGDTADSANKVHLGGLKLAGRMDPIFIDIRINATCAKLTSLKVELQQADTESGSYATVTGGDTGAILKAALVAGYKFGLRILPGSVTKPWLKLVYTIVGTTEDAGKITAALVREENLPYTAGLYIDKGVVKA